MSGCGCTGRSAPGLTLTAPGHDGPAAPVPVAEPVGGGSASVVTGPITRLNAVDGLFLRAAHLNAMQDYARALSRALGVGLGRGVVHGFGLTLEDDGTLTAGRGLAVTDTGDPVQSGAALTVALQAPELPPRDQDGFWLVVVDGGEVPADHEKAYGSVCADPCNGATTIQPWLVSTVRLRLVAQTMPGLDVVPAARRRSWLASRYFDRERCRALPWVVPDAADGVVDPLLPHPWTEAGATPGPLPSQVSLGVLLQLDDGPDAGDRFVLDQWTARRELSGPPGELRWAGHLAMRPWSVFLAQVLQFSEQLRAGGLTPSIPAKEFLEDPREAVVASFLTHNPISSKVGRQALEEFGRQFVAAGRPFLQIVEGGPLRQTFVELPPAGYLAPVPDGREGEARIRQLFDEDRVTLRFCQVRADAVAGEMQAAQHLDRIPLTADGVKPEVDVLVPSLPADLPTTTAQSYGWVAFVRSRPRSCAGSTPDKPKTEQVDLARTQHAVDDTLEALRGDARPDDVDELLSVDYPAGELGWPGSPDRPHDLEGFDILEVMGVASTQLAAELAAQRAKTLIEVWKLQNADAEAVISSAFSRPTLLFVAVAHVEPVP